jgi:uncharacterized membrane protein
MATEYWAIGLALFGSFTSSIEALFYKKASFNITRNVWSFIKNKYLYFGVSLSLFSSLIFIIALSGGELSLLYPITALKYIFISFISIYMFKEKMTFIKWLGILSIIFGVFFIGLSMS